MTGRTTRGRSGAAAVGSDPPEATGWVRWSWRRMDWVPVVAPDGVAVPRERRWRRHRSHGV